MATIHQDRVISVRAKSAVLLPLAMTHITNQVIMRVEGTPITDVIGTVTYTQCCISHVGSKQHINIMHKQICIETL
jgi:hypothetical protein